MFINVKALITLTAIIILTACGTTTKDVVVRPVEIDSTLLNPGRGFTTTGKTFNDGLKADQHPLSGLHQLRVYWNKLQPEEDKINFALIDSFIERCTANGQLLNFRVMCQNEDMTVPEWALEAGVKSPFYDNPVFLEKHANLIKALGERYDGHPGVGFVDIGTVGHWGEWHITPDAKDPKKIVYPSEASVKNIIDVYFSSFKKTPLVSLISLKSPYGYKYATSNGAGWRADCWGDMDSLGWNHMKGVYPPAIKNAGAEDSWKKGPIAFETCWTMNEWFKRQWDIDYILEKALEWHATGVNNGSEEVPEPWRAKVKEFEKKLGYRFVLDELVYPGSIKKGESIKMKMHWQNKGVAPMYNIYQLAFQLTSKSNPETKIVIAADADLRKIFPGGMDLPATIQLPGHITEGDYELELGIVVPGTKQPVVKLAIAGINESGWYKMGDIKVAG